MVKTMGECDRSLLLNTPLLELVKRANEIRRRYTQNKLELCSIINAKSGLCSEDCKFCAQSMRYSTNISSYPLMDKEAIVNAAKRAKEIGGEKFSIVTSGKKLSSKELDKVALAVSEIKNSVGIDVCASLGGLNKDELETLKAAGLKRYHHNIETSSRFYPNIVTTHSFSERLRTIRIAKSVGLEVCSGGIIGMGESWEDRIDMALLLKELDVDSIPINFLVPIKGTPLEATPLISCKEAIKTIAIFRIILKDKIIKIAAGRESILKDFQGMGFMAGANGMLIGGYLTIKGRPVEADYTLIREVKKMWEE